MADEAEQVSTNGLVDTKRQPGAARRRQYPEALKRQMVAETEVPTIASPHTVFSIYRAYRLSVGRDGVVLFSCRNRGSRAGIAFSRDADRMRQGPRNREREGVIV